jgi:hypothetical protein
LRDEDAEGDDRLPDSQDEDGELIWRAEASASIEVEFWTDCDGCTGPIARFDRY